MKGGKRDTAVSRAVVEDRLRDNVLTLAMHFKRDPDSGMAYFDQMIIRDEDKAEDAAEVPKPAPPA